MECWPRLSWGTFRKEDYKLISSKKLLRCCLDLFKEENSHVETKPFLLNDTFIRFIFTAKANKVNDYSTWMLRELSTIFFHLVFPTMDIYDNYHYNLVHGVEYPVRYW